MENLPILLRYTPRNCKVNVSPQQLTGLSSGLQFTIDTLPIHLE
jgi:hypothetical protein